MSKTVKIRKLTTLVWNQLRSMIDTGMMIPKITLLAVVTLPQPSHRTSTVEAQSIPKRNQINKVIKTKEEPRIWIKLENTMLNKLLTNLMVDTNALLMRRSRK